MTSSLLLEIQTTMKDAMRAKDMQLLGTIRLLLAAVKQREIDERIELDNHQIVTIINKMIKQRLDSIEQYQKGNRQDLADKELAEITVLKKYLPQSLTAEEVNTLIHEAISSIGATSIKEMAKDISSIKTKAAGRADMSAVSAMVKSMLEKQVN